MSLSIYEVKHGMLIREFNKYVREHPRFAAKIPANARIILQLEGDEEFNRWSEQLGRSHLEPGQPVLFVIIKHLRPDRSRIQSLELVTV
ncbi:MAG: hypothetical protein NZ610_01180 [Candidatus Bipolaricaulota bacterium]|nr:hypothetical protein [Candidatus Bipolaricaulota bacterium]MCS7274005.1 hypothetical protein [Candidatus Bipolaricaulota bacterium]MDW8111358.1 DUF5647 family protein [Candidatus Bipolaricaulota bacterium]MDW8329222.1 DUF5647 family protein [Candidatus Bipolaricaulota bacterium]